MQETKLAKVERAQLATKTQRAPVGTKRTVRRILNCRPSRDPDRDWRLEHAVGAGLLAAPSALPASVDLRESWWTIGDQGATGACVGWAAADSLLRWHFVRAGRLVESAKLSPRFIWMAAKETDDFETRPTTFIEADGTSLKAALDVARTFGAVPDAVLPFARPRLYGGEARAFYALAARLRIASYFNLGSSLRAWRTWLATQGPVLVRLDVDATWLAAKATGGALDVYRPDTAQGGHAVALVGYSPERFIVRNSWGTALWGDAGFAYASTAYATAAFTEAYGVTI